MNAWEPPPELTDVPVSVLLHGFFHYLSTHFLPRMLAVSIRTLSIIPKPLSNKCSMSFLCIEDPFETFDSHCPHDLGSPANSTAQLEIMTLLCKAERHVRAVLWLGEEGKLWNYRPKMAKGCASKNLVDKRNNNSSVPSVVREQGQGAAALVKSEAKTTTTSPKRIDDRNVGNNVDGKANCVGEAKVQDSQTMSFPEAKPTASAARKAKTNNGNQNQQNRDLNSRRDDNAKDFKPLARQNDAEQHKKTPGRRRREAFVE